MSQLFRLAYRLHLLPRRHHTFIFHRVLEQRDPIEPQLPTLAEFTHQLDCIRRTFSIIPLADSLHQPPSARPTASITFDDGYRDNHDLVAPVLCQRGVHATFFIATAFTDGDCMWNDWLMEALRAHPAGRFDLQAFGLGAHVLPDQLADRNAVLTSLRQQLKYASPEQRNAVVGHLRTLVTPPRLMMNADELRALANAGFDIGGHTHDHYLLSTLSDDAARWQIQHNRNRLTDITGQTPTLFAYPNGKPGKDYQARHIALVRDAGYRAAWTTEFGAWDGEADCYQIPRFTPWRWDALHYFQQLASIGFRRPQLLAA